MKRAALIPAKTPASGVTAPGAPTIGTATAAAGQVTVTSTAPGSTGGATIVAYTATGALTGASASSATTTIVVPMPLTGYTEAFSVVATNAEGLTSAPSALSNSVTPVSGSVATLRQVSTRTLINQVVASSATARSRVGSRTNPVDVTQLVLEYDNWYVEGFVNTAGSYNEINGSGTVTLEGAIEYPIGTFTRATLDGTVGGGNQATAGPGATARLICNVTIPAGGVYRSTFWASSTGNLPYAGVGTTGASIPATATPTFNASLNDITDIGAGLTSLVMASTGYSGSQNGLAIGWNRIMAVHSGIAVMNLGTSIDHGEAGMQDSAGAEGSAARSLVAANVAYTNMGVRGDSVQNFLTKGTKRAALQQYYTHILFGGPTNDVPLTLIAPDADTIYGYMQQQYAMFPGKKKFQCTVLPRAANDGSNGTGVTRAGNPIRVALNNLIKANSAGLDGYFDLCPPVESAPDAGTWKTGALTTDGTHPLQAGYLAIKNANIITSAALGAP